LVSPCIQYVYPICVSNSYPIRAPYSCFFYVVFRFIPSAAYPRYATFAALGGVSSADPRAEAAGLPPPDSMNLWPYLSGAVASSPRTSIHQDKDSFFESPYKLITGKVKGACWSGPHVPNASATGCTTVVDCQDGCLFDVFADPEERLDLASDPVHSDTLKKMQSQLTKANLDVFDPARGELDPRACAQAFANGGYWGPFSP
jgi:arylsulfatase I/J